MARSKFRIDPAEYAGAPSVSEGATQETKTKQQAIAEKKKVKKTAEEKHYMQLNIARYKEYLDAMSKADGRPKTKYILKLIEEDMERRQEEYEAVKNLERIRNK